MPEADPQLLLGPSPLTTPYASFPYNFGNLYNPYFNALPVATPAVAAKVITPAAPLAVPAVAGALPQLRPYTPYNCVTAEGCAVLTLKDHGLAKREAEAEADPEAYYGSFYNPYYGFNGLYNGYYPHSYGAYPYGVNSLWNYAAHGLGYATGFEQFEGYPASTAPLAALPAPAPFAAPLAAPLVAAPAPVVKTVEVPAPALKTISYPYPAPAPLAAPLFAAPTPVVKAVEVPAPAVKTITYPAPVVNAVPATPLPVFRAAPIVHAPLPVVRKPVVTPIVKTLKKPVTYTHLGAHPIQPTTVFVGGENICRNNIPIFDITMESYSFKYRICD